MNIAWSGGMDMLQALLRCRELQPVRRGATPFIVVLEDAPFRLRRYHLPEQNPTGRPLLIVYSTINRPDLLDLSVQRSMIRPLLEAGLDVHVVDWGDPLDADSMLDLEDYLDGFLHRAVEHVAGCQAGTPVDAVGICQGGTLLTCYAALRPARIRSLVNLGTPLDFHAAPNALTRLAGTFVRRSLSAGNVPGHVLSASFAALRPTDLFIRRYDALPQLAMQTRSLEEFLRMEAWMYDCPDQPAVMFQRFVERFYQENALVTGKLSIGSNTVRLEDISAAVLNIHAEEDHLVPPASTRALASILPPERYDELVCPGGHLGLFLSGAARRRVVPAIIRWLERNL